MQQPTILIISNPLDSHIPYVTKHLDKNEVLVIDPLDEIIQGDGLDYDFTSNILRILHGSSPLTDITSVWYRKPSGVNRDSLPLSKEKTSYAASSLYKHVGSMTHLFPDAFWMSDRSAILRANSKPLQCIYASKLGFNVPDTLFASESKAAAAFVKKHGVCVAKTQAQDFPPGQIVFTKIIRHEDDLSFEGLRFDPYIFQQYIEPERELRVTVVGDKVFAATMLGSEVDGINSSYRDWRYAYVNDTFKAEKATVPREIAEQCITLVHNLGLTYGAIDLIVDKKGKTWFLEINPNGQWAFVENDTGQQIGKAIAQRLRIGNKKLI